ncbi:MAG TPA: hypothetical protein DCQ31_06030 [Bacteroidales bacterium]|nr:hypothetical protein [Bacteroidales bacterium]
MSKTVFHIVVLLMFCEKLYSQQSDYYVIPTQTLNTYELLGLNSKTNYNQTIKTFEISKFITLKEYNEFLQYIKKRTTRKFYVSQLPDTSIISEKEIKKYLRNKGFQDKPIVGISWESAMNFCKWKTQKENLTSDIKFIYRLPNFSEWLFSQYFLKNSSLENDFNKNYSDWLINAKDDSYYFDIYYDALESDPPALKRKVAIGNSFLFKQPTFGDYFNFSYYSFNGYPQIGFRYVKVHLNDSIFANKYSIENSILKSWNIAQNKSIDSCITLKSFIKDSVLVEYQTNNNLFNGYYISKYKKGQIKSIGYFVDNMKLGLWSIWDSLGNLKSQRFYNNNYEYETIFPKNSDIVSAKYQVNKKYKLTYNANKFISYFIPTERMIVASETNWFKIDYAKNPMIFNNQILEILYNELTNKKIICYSKDFKDTLNIENLPLLDTIKLVGFKAKELWYFDNYRFISEKRIFDFVPLITTTNCKDTIDLGVFYFPALRKIFARIKITSNNQKIKTLDDLFFFKYYYGTIFKSELLKNESDYHPKIDYNLILIEKEIDIISNFN